MQNAYNLGMLVTNDLIGKATIKDHLKTRVQDTKDYRDKKAELIWKWRRRHAEGHRLLQALCDG